MKLDCEGKNMNKTMLLVLTVISVIAISYYAGPVFGDQNGTDDATCAISVTVDSIVEWEGGNFDAIDLDSQAAHITQQNSAPAGSAVYSLWTNSNVELTANNTTASQLTHSRGGGAGVEDTLVTWYKISTDGDGDAVAGISKTGSTDAAIAASNSDTWVTNDEFLKAAAGNAALDIAHYNTDGRVEVTLEVQATNDADNVADRGLYQAVQTITATWTSDN
jgi:hypothetical protein